MGRRDRHNSKFDWDKASEEDLRGSTHKSPTESVAQLISSDDGADEANEDLSLKIVEKALLMRAANLAPDNDVVSSPSQESQVAAAADLETNKVSKRKRVRTKKMEIEDQPVVGKEEEKVEAANAVDLAEVKQQLNNVEITDNIVLRKLLRAPRYFDPPNSSWGTCFNCGEEGHAAVNCIVARQKKPCFVCGSLEHNAKQCRKGQDCFICKQGGHHAKDCPEKHKGGSLKSQICLKCGDCGHDMFSCRNDYSTDDLKEIQCYVCKRFGHLCCVKYVDTNPREVSCYKCGQLGHTGMACVSLHGWETTDFGSPHLCYKCGEGGHITRECTSSANACVSLRGGESTDLRSSCLCYKCSEGGHIARECTSSSNACVSLRGRESTGLRSSRRRRCYKCREGGHIASECTSSANACVSLRGGETTDFGSSLLCYQCGEGGHIAHECTTSANAHKIFGEFSKFSTPNLKAHKEKRDYTGFKSTPHDLNKVRKRKQTQYEERDPRTPQKAKHRGGWIMDDPGDFCPRKGKKNSRKSPATPSTWGHMNSSWTAGGHVSSSRSSNKMPKVSRSPVSQGSSKPFQHSYSASRFSNSSADGIRRNYDGGRQ